MAENTRRTRTIPAIEAQRVTDLTMGKEFSHYEGTRSTWPFAKDCLPGQWRVKIGHLGGASPISIDSLRTAFDKVTCDAGVKDFVFHDFRHCAKTRWAAEGLPGNISDVGSGHAIPGTRGRYTNLTDQNIRDAFEKMFTTCSHGNDVRAEVGAK